MTDLETSFRTMMVRDQITSHGVWCSLELVDGKLCWSVQGEGGGVQLSWSADRAWHKFQKMIRYEKSLKVGGVK